ncbi:Uma2 family endonuclease [Spirulina sp. CS-785/01]|uniref:Uma2 family endonuclease n=1 Tax=Spirulina sp. CS-785/01 TaxID=3021716 RepID=UPI00232D9B34|nr:Uma2 family endonuclease [Spirulina sp. CS-785/01]MDB9311791.1 Uma2 family endonuclease [Spirulina sp. CS-785/01]
MTQSIDPVSLPPPFPDHTQLPEEDGTFVKNFQEHPQSILLTDSLGLVLRERHPDGHYAIGQDSGIYWRLTDPPQRGAEAPDWYYVPNVPPLLDGQHRRSYVLWRELISPLIALEFASGTGEEERDRTTLSQVDAGEAERPGKFWVYEQIIHIAYYGIYWVSEGQLEMYHLVNGFYHPLPPNDRGHYPIEPLGIELGLWEGNYQNQHSLWLRWWDNQGNLLLTGREQSILDQQQADQERQRAEAAERSQQEAIPRLLSMGLTPEQVTDALGLTLDDIHPFL